MTPLISPLTPKHTKISTFLLAAFFAQAAAADTDVEFDAVYQVYIDGKPRMETRISLARQGELWLMTSDGKGTKGLPRMLKLRNTERSEGRFSDEQFQPVEYSHRTKVVGKDDSWTASFDRESNRILTRHEHGESSLEPASGTVDPLSLTLALRSRLADGVTDFTINIVDEAEIDQHKYHAGVPEELKTQLGCFTVTSVKRIRENSSRYSAGWYAQALDFFPLKLLHGKEGGKEFEMRIIKLVLDGKDISSQANCPA